MFIGLRSAEVAQLNVRSVDVTSIERFTINNHVFGYRVTGVIAGFDNHGRRIHAGSVEIVYYYDPDGSGKFTVMNYDASSLAFRIIVPDWVKRN